MYSNILFERKAGIAVITLNRPRVLNALSRALKGELSDKEWARRLTEEHFAAGDAKRHMEDFLAKRRKRS